MSPRTKARLISLAALLPLLIVAVAGPGYDRLRCAFSGEITDMSCCPAQDPPAGPVANAASCCDHESARVVKLPAEVAPSATTVAIEAPSLPSLPELVPAAAPIVAPRATSQAPPPTPLILVKQSFLI